MIKNQDINKEFIEIIKNSIPKGQLPADVISDIISIHRESAYRRLRGQIKFSFEEVVKIQHKLQLPLERIFPVLGIKNKDHIGIRISLLTDQVHQDNYCKSVIDIMTESDFESRYCNRVMNSLPYNFIFRYDWLSKIHYYKWLGHNYKFPVTHKLYKEELPENIRTRQKALSDFYEQADITYIFSDSIFTSLYKDIKYLQFLKLIDEESILVIKDELRSMMEGVNKLCFSGKFDNGNEISIYLSNIEIENTFSSVHNKKDDDERPEKVIFTLYGMNHIISDNHQLLSLIKESFENLKSYSTLITLSGAKQRCNFFNAQYELIDQL